MQNSDLFKQLGLSKLSDKDKLKLTEDLGGIVMSRVAARLEAILTTEQALEFETLLHTDEAKGFYYLETIVPNYPEIVSEEIEALRDDMKYTHAVVMKKLGY